MNEEQEVALDAATTAMQDAQDESAEGQTDEDAAPDVDPEGDAEVEKSESQKRRERRKANQERLKAELDATKKAAAEARAKLARMEESKTQAKEPKRDDYDDPDQYVADLAAFRSVQSISAMEAQRAKETADGFDTSAQNHAAEMWKMQIEDARERFTDFEAVAYSAPISDSVATLIATTEGGADIAYHLGKNHHIAARLSQMSQLEAAIEIGKLSASLSSPQAKLKTGAPPPIKPVSGRGAGARKSPSEMSMAEYEAWTKSR